MGPSGTAYSISWQQVNTTFTVAGNYFTTDTLVPRTNCKMIFSSFSKQNAHLAAIEAVLYLLSQSLSEFGILDELVQVDAILAVIRTALKQS